MGAPRAGRHLSILLGLVAIALAAAGAAAASDAAPDVGDRVTVGLDPVPEDLSVGDELYGHTVVDLDRALGFAVVNASSPQAVREGADGNVTYLEQDRWVEPYYNPTDPDFDKQYGPQQVRAPGAWEVGLGSTDAAVCVVDSGVRKSHEEFPSERILGDRDFRNDDGNAEYNGVHGTHVAGIAAAEIDNAQLVAGVGNVGLYVAESMGKKGGSASDVAQGIRWCADQDEAIVINLSLGSSHSSSPMKSAVEYAWNKGALVVAAAGNDGCNGCVGYPAKYDESIAVSCTNANRNLCSFSSHGTAVDLAAPGRDILSTAVGSDTATRKLSGTSMSTPHVAGVAALAWSHQPSMENDFLRDRLEAHAVDIGPDGEDARFGKGLVQADELAEEMLRLAPLRPLGTWTFDDGVSSDVDTSGLWHATDRCHDAPSAPNYLGYHRPQECTYQTFTRTRGSAAVTADLSGTYRAHLAFEHRWDVEPGWSSNADLMLVQARAQGEDGWNTLARWDPSEGSYSTWRHEEIGLGGYLGEQIELRFRFDSNDALLNEFEGWAIDDVTVQASTNLRPIAEPGPAGTVGDHDADGTAAVPLDASASTDLDGTVEAYRWLVDGQVVAQGQQASAQLPVGEHDVTLEVEDHAGDTDRESLPVTVKPNRPPTARPADVEVGDHDADGTVDAPLDGTPSTDPDAEPAAYTWYKDGDVIATGATPKVTLPIGEHAVTLEVEDHAGETDRAPATVTVLENRDPHAAAADRHVPPDGGEATVTLDGRASFDPDGETTSYTWTLDGSVIAEGPRANVTLAEGTHHVTLSVDDEGNGTGTDEAVVRVTDGPRRPSAQAGPELVRGDHDGDGEEPVTLGRPLALEGRERTDDDDWTTVDFGDAFDQAPSVLAQVQTKNGGQAAVYGEARSVDEGGAEVRFCESDGTDWCDWHNEETVAWLALRPGALHQPVDHPIGHAGIAEDLDDAEWANVPVPELPREPVAFATSNTQNGPQNPSNAEVRDVDGDTFQTRHCEYDAVDTCDDHQLEANGWALIDPTAAKALNGLDAGQLTLADQGTATVAFDERFPDAPLVFAQIQTDAGQPSTSVRVHDVTADGATLELCEHEDENTCDSDHAAETVAWWAIDPVLAGLRTGDPDGSTLDHAWYLDGTLVSTQAQPTLDLAIGEHDLVYEVTDGDGLTDTDEVTVEVTPNQDPIARAPDPPTATDADGSGTEPIPLDASNATDPDGQLTEVTWTLDGELLATGPTPTVSLAPGEHAITLTVHDDGNGTDTELVTATVLPNRAPEAVLEATCVVTTCRLDATASSDPDADVEAYRWTLGDTTATGPTLEHTFERPGRAQATLTVEDAAGATDQATRTLRLDAPGAVQPPTEAPPNPLVEDTTYEPGDATGPAHHLDVEAAWLTDTPRNLYVGMSVENVLPPGSTTQPASYTVRLDPGWSPDEPAWGTGASVTDPELQVRAVPIEHEGTRGTGGHVLTLEVLDASSPAGHAGHTVAELEGTVSPEGDTVWWIVPRDALQAPGKSTTVDDVRAYAGPPDQRPADRAGPDGPAEVGPFDMAATDSRYHGFDASPEGLQRHDDQALSAVAWDPSQANVLVHSDRFDPRDERLATSIDRLEDDESFVLTARWGVYKQGNWQKAYPVYLGEDVDGDVEGNANAFYVRYRSWDVNRGQDPRYEVHFLDGDGSKHLNFRVDAPVFQVNQFLLAYDADARTVTGAVLAEDGELVGLQQAQLRDGDTFAFEELGVAANGHAASHEPAAEGWTDDILLHRWPSTG